MRGEETQLIGCAIQSDEERIFILPGTHSKHVLVKQQKAFSFQTFMTGEFLDLLSTKSILANSIEKHAHFDLMAFEAGVMKGLRSNFLQECFAIRTNELFGKISKESNYDYLKGLLLGTELKELSGDKRPITIVGTELVNRDYQAALKILQLNRIRVEDSERATIHGHYKILRLLNKNS
jgi:2-dehydro-3-deoxygalactonokinase